MPISVPARLAADRERRDDVNFTATIADAALADCPVIRANDRFFDLTGYPPAEATPLRRFASAGPKVHQ